MEGDAVGFHQIDELLRCVAAERRDREFGVPGNEPIGPRVDVGKIAAATARDADLLAGRLGVVDHQHRAAALARFDRRHHPGGAGSEHHYIDFSHCRAIARRARSVTRRDVRDLPLEWAGPCGFMCMRTLLALAAIVFATPSMAEILGLEVRGGAALTGYTSPEQLLSPFTNGRLEDVSVDLMWNPPVNPLFLIGSPGVEL